MQELPSGPRRLVPLTALALAGVLAFGAGVALSRSGPSGEPAAGAGATRTATAPTTSPTPTTALAPTTPSTPAAPPSTAPSPPSPVPRLPARDLAGRVAPPVDGWTAVPDEVSGLGRLSGEQAVGLAAGLPDDAAAALSLLRQAGLRGAYARASDGPDANATVLVLRLGSRAATQRYVDRVRDDQGGTPAAAAGGTTFLVDGQPTARAAVFRRGVHAYQVTLLGEPAAVRQDELERLLRAQAEHARATG